MMWSGKKWSPLRNFLTFSSLHGTKKNRTVVKTLIGSFRGGQSVGALFSKWEGGENNLT